MDKKNAFPKAKVNRKRDLYKGSLFSFVAEDITLPNGKRTEMAMVHHPGSTGIVPLLDDGKIVMVNQYRHSVRDYLLEIPAGTIESGESPINCARRELEEETGLVAKEFIELAQVYIIPSYSNEKIHVYLARGFSPSRQNLDQDEILHVVKHPFEDVIQMINQGFIVDALTVLSIHQAHMYIQKRL